MVAAHRVGLLMEITAWREPLIQKMLFQKTAVAHQDTRATATIA
jgi:hypothetical protein